jgi:ATP-dependent DNA ligase
VSYPLENILLPMGAKEVKDEKKMEALWDNPEYIAEEKLDGSRYLSVGGRFFSRRISDVTGFPVEKTAQVPHLAAVLQKYPNLILDGEVYYPGMSSNEVTSIMGSLPDKACRRQGLGELKRGEDGSTLYWRLDSSQEWKKLSDNDKEDLLSPTMPLKYVLFDILRDEDGNWLIDLPWKERRKKLEEFHQKLIYTHEDNAEDIEISTVISSNKREFYDLIVSRGGEGVMLKNINGKYVPDKKPAWNWVKVKKHITDDVVIIGFKPPVREYEGKELESWQYWENLDKTFTGEIVEVVSNACVRHAVNADGDEVSVTIPATIMRGLDADGIIRYVRIYGDKPSDVFEPVTKFYWHNWIGAVKFGKYDKEGNLVELGECSGLTDELRKDMSENPDKYIGQVMEIGAMEKTRDGFYRHPQFSRMRPDKNPHECVIEEQRAVSTFGTTTGRAQSSKPNTPSYPREVGAE